MSTVAEIKDAIQKPSPREREKLAEAAKGRFLSGDRSSLKQILSNLE